MDDWEEGGVIERVVDTALIEELEDKLLAMVREAADGGLTHDEVMFAFARSAYRLSTPPEPPPPGRVDRKSTRLNSSH